MINKYVSEGIGTFFLVFAGTGAVVANDLSNGAVGHVGISLTFGLIVMTMIYAIGDVSGAHINPAVTIAFAVAGRLPKKECLPYVCSQLTGATLASLVLRLIFNHPTLGITTPAIPLFGAFLFEVLLSFLLMFLIIHVSTGAQEKGMMAGVAVGGMVCLEAMFGGPITGASMNPARSLGPAIVSGHLSHLWIYLTAPVIGAILAVPTCRIIRKEDCCQ